MGFYEGRIVPYFSFPAESKIADGTQVGNKTVVIYERHDPNQSGVTFVAIQTNSPKPYVFATYSIRRREDLPKLPSDMLVVPVEQAKGLFDFKKGNLADLVR